MTRFARAKGSKSSNLKDPENSTPWEVMKEQMLKAKAENEDSKKRIEAEQQRIENYENFLKERKVAKRKAEWCDFPEVLSQKKDRHNSKSNSETGIFIKNNVKKVNESEEATIKLKKNKKNKHKNIKSQNALESNDTQDINNCENEQVSEKDENQSMEINKTENTINKKKKNKKKQDLNKSKPEQNQVQDQQNVKVSNVQLKKKKIKNGDNAVRRKEITERSFQLIINGKDVELVRFEGFPIMKKDAERLQDLKNNMIKKGIPKTEVQRTIKLERRRAEKALARLKRDVCYNCRKGGHNLSDCPDLKSNIPGVDVADGVCFKCGSTEHRQNECKVQKDKEFRFATCFICRETGHLARQCPDNPKGLYPNGGSCKLCGDVTHLRKDCPTVAEEKESKSIKLPTLDGTDDIEDIGQSVQAPTQQSKKPKKIKF